MTPEQELKKQLPTFLLFCVLLLIGYGCNSAFSTPTSTSSISPTRVRATPVLNTPTSEATVEAKGSASLVQSFGTRAAKQKATREAKATATEEVDVEATETAEIVEWELTIDASDRTSEAGYYATETAEARGCPDGCTFYPDWCAPPIKGNVSVNSGEPIYHMPGDEFYADTVINPDYGELYFCTSEEAETNGFRRAYR
jgi:hypothetical protein